MLSNEQLKQILLEQKESLLSKPEKIVRSKLSEVGNYLKLPHVIVITGLRRVGKSTFLRQIIKEFFDDKNFYYINFEDERLLNFKTENFNELYETLIELFGVHKTFFIDEIQNVENFQNFIRRFYDDGYKFFITGSNANLLSREIGSKLTGRHLDITINPFSFAEYLGLNEITIHENSAYISEEKGKIKKAFEEYLIKGGMPEYLIYGEREILTRVYEDIVIKDIAVRNGISNIYEMRELFQYLITNFANRFSFTKVQKLVKLGSVNTVKNYIHNLAETYFVSIVNKYDHSLKKQLANEKKLYVIDNGFIPLISTRVTKDYGWFLENLVFNELNKHNNVYYFNELKTECDFLIERNKQFSAFQVCWELTSDNLKREQNGLIAAMKYFGLSEGTILTNSQEENLHTEAGEIKVLPVWKWLLKIS